MEEITIRSDAEIEKNLHRDIEQYIRLRGFLAFYGRMDKKTGRVKGEPDYICLLPMGRTLYIECKVARKGLDDNQKAIKTHMETLGHTMHVIRNLVDFIALCRETEAE